MGAGRNGRGSRAHRIEQLGASDEDDAGARQGEQPAARSRIVFEIMTRPFDRADGDRIDDQPSFRAGLDREQATDFAHLAHS